MTSVDNVDDLFQSTYLFSSQQPKKEGCDSAEALREILGEQPLNLENTESLFNTLSVDHLDISQAEEEAESFLTQLISSEINNNDLDDVFTCNYDNNSRNVNETVLKGNTFNKFSYYNSKQDTNSNRVLENRSKIITANELITNPTDLSIETDNRIKLGMTTENNNGIKYNSVETLQIIESNQKRNYGSEVKSSDRDNKRQLYSVDEQNTANLSDDKNEQNYIQEKYYSRAIEDFKTLRTNLTENMEKNLMRTEYLGLANNRRDFHRSHDNIIMNNLRSQGDVYSRNKNIEQRYSSHEHLYKRRSDCDINLEEKRNDSSFHNSPKTTFSRMLSNNVDVRGHNNNNVVDMRGQSLPRPRTYSLSYEQQREQQSHLRDQAARSNFERYLKGSVIIHQNTIDSVGSYVMNSNPLEDPDHGYGGSGSTSPREPIIPVDQLSSRSGSVNSHHSRTSSALTSVDSGVRLSFVGQHNSLVVVAIDFGTTFSGYAFAFTRDSSSIHMMRRWEGGDPGVTNQKTPTTLLLKPDGTFHSFGFGARDFYHDLDSHDAKKWLYFDKFKMTLHASEDLHAGIEIKAANGKLYPALKVFGHSLRFFKEHVLAELSDQSTAKLTEDDITWVLTVPAIWRQPAKQFMRTAAYEAGIASIDHPDRLLIALEPEAASIFCRKLRIRDCVIEDDLKAKAGDDSLISEDFVGITQYVVVDCGGGTVDLTVHELDVTQGTLKELHKGTGGPCGATGVDTEFEKLLKRIFDADFIEKFKIKRPAAWIDLMISFEAKKRTARPDNKSPLNISLPFSFIEYHKKHRKCSVETAVKKFKNPDIKWSSQGMLRFSANIMQALFEPILNAIIGHIQNLLTRASLKNVEHLFLVGGFAESPLLQYSVREGLEGRVRVIIPNDVGLAILKGAVLFGLDPTVVRVRRSAYTYGVGVLNKFDPQKHEQSKRVVKDGIVWCKDIFDRFVRVDESVGIGDHVTRSYAPARSKQKSTVINIYCTEKLDVLYTTDKGVKRCGKLRIEMPDVSPEEIPIEKRGKPRELQASMIFGDTEIKVAAVDVLSGRAARSIIDFLNY